MVERDISKHDGFIERDYRFENLVVWGLDYAKGDYQIEDGVFEPTRSKKEQVPSSVIPQDPPSSKFGPISFPLQRVQQSFFSNERLQVSQSCKAYGETIEVDKGLVLKELSLDCNLELNKLFPDNDLFSRNAQKDLEEEEHRKLLKEQEEGFLQDQRTAHTYNLKDFPLAEPELINQLAETHTKFFQLLSKLQNTHTPDDFVTAFRIQDRIAYLLDNQTLLYKTLTKKLIWYLERINKRLEKYYSDITIKQEDIKKMNAQISRFNEYDRKTQSRIDQAEKETNLFKKDLQSYQDSLRGLKSELQSSKAESVPESQELNQESTQDLVVH